MKTTECVWFNRQHTTNAFNHRYMYYANLYKIQNIIVHFNNTTQQKMVLNMYSKTHGKNSTIILY